MLRLPGGAGWLQMPTRCANGALLGTAAACGPCLLDGNGCQCMGADEQPGATSTMQSHRVLVERALTRGNMHCTAQLVFSQRVVVTQPEPLAPAADTCGHQLLPRNSHAFSTDHRLPKTRALPGMQN